MYSHPPPHRLLDCLTGRCSSTRWSTPSARVGCSRFIYIYACIYNMYICVYSYVFSPPLIAYWMV